MEAEISQDTGNPYLEEGEIRTFFDNTPEDEFVWHRDREDRWIEPLHDTDWQFQYENQLPQPLTKLFIEKETYHRLIKGNGDLKLKVIKCY